MDDSVTKLLITLELAHPFFFSQQEIVVENPKKPFDLRENFLYELFYYNGIRIDRPWINPEETIPILLIEWQKVKDQLHSLHHNREHNNIAQIMKKGIGLFLQLLFWSNGHPVQLKDPSFSQMDFKPVNVQERLEFIISRPKLYHSFVQLTELINEQEKQYVKKNILKKASRRKV